MEKDANARMHSITMTRSFWVLLPDTLESWVENTATLRHASEVNSLRLKDAANKGYRVGTSMPDKVAEANV